jgi:4-amino-4-deoxy-L-arabinose transferase-like glycosyltransferase
MSLCSATAPARRPSAEAVHRLLALGLFGAAQLLFLSPSTRWLAVAVLATAFWVARSAGFADGALPPGPRDLPNEILPRRGTLVLLVLIVGIAAFFRLWHLESVPPGLYVDEVLTTRNAFAWRLAHGLWYGSRPLAAPGWVETSNLYLAFASSVLHLFGDGLLGIRMISVLPSLGMVPLTYLLGAVLGGRRVGLLAAFLLAFSHWAGRTGRTGWDEVLLTALTLAVLFLVLLALRLGRTWPAAPAGLILGLSLYTYVASRLVALQVAVWLVWEVWRRASERRVAVAAATCLGIAALTAAPYFWYLGTASAGGADVRLDELAVTRAAPRGRVVRTLADNLTAHLLMFNSRGAHYVRDDLPDYPMLDPLTGTLFLAGLVVVFGPPGWRRRLLVSWAAIQLLGGVLSTSLGALPTPTGSVAWRPGPAWSRAWGGSPCGTGSAWLWRRADGDGSPWLRR